MSKIKITKEYMQQIIKIKEKFKTFILNFCKKDKDNDKKLLLQVTTLVLSLFLFYVITGHPQIFASKNFWMGKGGDRVAYYKSAVALFNLNFDPEQHFYSPLYPLLGSFFYFFSKNDPFWIIDILCFIGFLFYAIKTLRFYIKKDWVIWLLLFITCHKLLVLKQFLTPWTSQPVRFFLAYLIYQAHKKEYKSKDLFLSGLFAGLVISARPLDTLMAFIVFMYIFMKVFLTSYKENLKKCIKKLLVLSLPGFIGLSLFLSFNIVIGGNIWGKYATAIKTSYEQPFDFFTFPSRLISILFDSSGIYGARACTLFGAFPLFFFSICGILYVLLNFKKYKELSVISLMIITQWITYNCYVDMLAINFWVYKNYHYYLWQFPFLGLLAYVFLGDIYIYKKYKSSLIIISCAFIFSSIQFDDIQYKTSNIKFNKEERKISFQVEKPKDSKIKYIEFSNFKAKKFNINTLSSKIEIPLDSKFSRLYNTFRYSIINGKKADLYFLRNSKANKSNTKIRIIFVAQQNKESFDMIFNEDAFDIDSLKEIKIDTYSYKYTIGFPVWLIDYFSFISYYRKPKIIY